MAWHFTHPKKAILGNEISTITDEAKPSDKGLKHNFVIDTKGVIHNKKGQKAQGSLQNDSGQKISAKILNNYEVTEFEPEINAKTSDGFFEISLGNRDFKPGKYKLQIDLEDGSGGKEIVTKEFFWGVLAINTNKATYLAGETAFLQMAALKDDGHTICDGNLALEVSSPAGVVKKFTTHDGTISSSPKCLETAVTDEPDYSTHYVTKGVGTYTMKLKNLDNNFEITDTFAVKSALSFEIERTGPTRIYPPADYEMQLKVTANEDFSGEVADFVPASFELKTPDLQTDTSDPEVTKIYWEVNWQKGQTYDLSYIFKAPDISPKLYLLGPLNIGGLLEARQWQIAADAVYTSTSTGGTWATGSTWVGGIAPGATDDAIIATTGANNVSLGAATTIVNVTINSGATISGSNRLLTVNGNYTNNGTHSGTGGVTMATAGAVIDGTGNTSNTGTFTLTNSKTVNGTGTAANLTIAGTIALSAATTVTNNGTITASGSITGANATTSVWTQGNNSTLKAGNALLSTGTLNASNSGNTVNYNRSAIQTVKAASSGTYYHLTLSGTSAKGWSSSVTTISGNMTLSGTASTTPNIGVAISGNLDIGNGTSLTFGAYTFSVTGTTTVTGSLINNSATGTKTFTGDVTVTGTWNESGAAVINFGGSLTNNASTWTGNSGIHTFTGSGKTISGGTTTTIANITIGSGASVTNSGTVTCSTALASGGAGSTWTNGNGSTGTLNFAGSSIGVATFTASAASNLVNYNGAAQTIFATTTYHDLTLSTSGAKTWGATPSAIDGNLTLSGTATTAPSAATVTVSGNVDIGTGTTLTAPATLNVAGNWTNSATFTPGSNIVYFTGGSTQQVNAGGSGAGKPFNNLTHSGAGTLQLTTTAIDVDGNFSQTNGTFDANSLNQNFAGDFSLSAGTTYTKGGTLTFDGTAAKTYEDLTAGHQNIGAVAITKTDATPANNKITLKTSGGNYMKVDILTISANNTLDLNSNSYTLEVANAGATATVFTATGTLTPGTSTVLFTATNSSGNIDVAVTTYNNLQFTPGSAETYDMTGDLTGGNALTGNLTIDANATLDTRPLASDYDITAVNVTISGTLDCASSASIITASGNWDHSAGTFTYGTSTVALSGAPGSSVSVNTTDETKKFYDLNLPSNGSGTATVSFDSNIGVDHHINLGNSYTTLTSASGVNLFIYGGGRGADAPVVNNGVVITMNKVVFRYRSANVVGGTDITGGTYNTTFEVRAEGYDYTYYLAGNITTNWMKFMGAYGNFTCTIDLNGYNMNSGTVLEVGLASTTGRWAILQNTGSAKSTVTTTDLTIVTPDVSSHNKILANGANTIDFNVSGNWANNDVFTAGTSTVNMTGTGAISGTNDYGTNKVFYDLSIGASGQVTTLSTPIGITHLLTLGAGTVTSSSSYMTVYNSVADYTPLSIDGSSTVTNTGLNIAISADTTLPASTRYYSVNCLGDSATPYDCNLAGDVSFSYAFSVSGNHSGDKGILDLNGHNLTCNTTYGVGVGTSGDTTKNGVIQNTGGAKSTMTTLGLAIRDGSGNNQILANGAQTIDFNVAGNWSNADTFTAGASTVTFNKSSDTQTLTSGGTTTGKIFNNLTHSGAGTLQLVTNDINIDGNFTNSGGTFDTNSKDMTIGGNVDLTTGSFTQGTRTITLDGSAAQSFTAGGTGAGHTPYNLVITNSAGPTNGVIFSDSLTLASGGTFTDTTANTKLIFTDGASYNFPLININGSGAGDVTMTWNSGGHGHWHFIVPGTPTVTYVAVDHSDATGSGAEIDATSNCHNNNNNTYWNFGSGATPTVDEMTFTNPYGGSGNTAIADDTTSWQFQTKVTDSDGPTNINYVEMRFANGTDATLPYDSLKFRWTESTNTFSEEADTQDAATLTSTGADASAVGNQWTLNFKIELNNNFSAKDTQYNIEVYALDDTSLSADSDFANKYQVTALSLSLDVDSPTIAFGDLLPGSVVTSTTVSTVTTNYPNGYTLGISDGVAGAYSALLHTDTVTRIADYAGTIGVPTLWSDTGLGICVYIATNKDAKWGSGVSEADVNNKYAGVPETNATITSKTGSPTTADTTSIGYKMVVPNNQKTGDYAGNVTYSATGVLL